MIIVGGVKVLSEKTGYGYGNEVQAKENERQRGFEKVWDTVLSDYGKQEFE
jgi:hypothetical protein